ncbi:MAG TPA: MBL fold metallo-hydrolase [Longimicrobiales bacterium]|nr:MBL fold metallo-hydrolase [Longimicrobiales bacterium]
MTAPHSPGLPMSRRRFLGLGASCGAHLALLAVASPAAARTMFRLRGPGKVVVEEPWARIEEVADGVWAVISTPLQDRKTVCNGAIVAGKERALVVESFGSADGARWVAGWARRLTGRTGADVLVTHYHADHTGGVEGYAPAGEWTGSRLRTTRTTIDLVRGDDARRKRAPDAARDELLGGAEIVDVGRRGTIDLGGRVLRVVPRAGHTASDLTVELDEARVVIAGDLLWNRMFPNYVDATPSVLSKSVHALPHGKGTVYVPGHGPMADADDLRRYRELLDAVEDAARRAHRAGVPAAEAAKTFKVPASLGEWLLFSPRYYEVALGAWEKELGAH